MISHPERANHKRRRVPTGPRGNGIGRVRHSPFPNPTRNAPMHFRPTNFPKPDKDLSAGLPRLEFPRCADGPDDFSRATSRPAQADEIVARHKKSMALARPLFLSTARRTVPSGTNQADA